MINVGIIGFGKYGKKYFNFLKKSPNFKVIKILRKKKIKNSVFTNNISNFLKIKYIDLYIISSPTITHYEYLDKILVKNKHVIIEKPLVKYKFQYKKLIKRIKNFKKIILMNHTDLYMNEYKKLKEEIKNLGNIKSVKLFYGKDIPCNVRNILTVTDLPFFEWFPHPLAIINDLFFEKEMSFALEENKKIRNKYLIQTIKVYLKKKIDIKIFFSNNYKKPKRDLIIHGTGGCLIYKGYQKKKLFLIKKNKKKFLKTENKDPIENLLNNFLVKIHKKNSSDDRNIILKTTKNIFKISDRLTL